jgi:hypothetical protein
MLAVLAIDQEDRASYRITVRWRWRGRVRLDSKLDGEHRCGEEVLNPSASKLLLEFVVVDLRDGRRNRIVRVGRRCHEIELQRADANAIGQRTQQA